ncbi:hypothetical protein PR003_g11653 [Phytophthora rubi]|uniref:Uncharacterized protein n=1 Tax=Phytophthora rubi TaxID=129364 RepID=A0A6A3N3P8_9STRA|nr:hypothetical protein PR002_g7560 [Phytophthora rubi]KAE9040110.1 hypothetical protein PR001_g7223 [Phytophthora rubi]KAE9338159.1 hypothetical protein PR003_g11653 [Phytophthora rubi]
MASQSLSSSSASTIPSVLENSDYEEKQSTSGGDASASYADESFDSESDPVHESTGPAPVQSDGSSEKYGSEEFEDDYEVSDTIDPVMAPEAEGGGKSSESTEENDYDGEPFEQEEGPVDDHEEVVSIQKDDMQIQSFTHN